MVTRLKADLAAADPVAAVDTVEALVRLLKEENEEGPLAAIREVEALIQAYDFQGAETRLAAFTG